MIGKIQISRIKLQTNSKQTMQKDCFGD